MGMSVGGGGGLTNEPNVVPMIDILLVLLIIFMIMQPMMRRAIDLQLPDPQPVVAPALEPAAPVREPVASRRIASTAAIGMASLGALYFSTRSYLRHRESLALTRAARESDQAHRVSLAPTITPATGSAGVTLNLRF